MTGIDHAGRLLDQLLDMARSDGWATLAEPDFVPVQLESLYHRIMSDLGPAASERELTLSARFEVKSIMAVEHGLLLLLHNLLRNAIYYTPRGGRVVVHSALQDGRVMLTVDDSGPGIPAQRRAEAFERFNRLGRADAQGVGLGLSIVKSVAQAHGATVQLQSSPLGGLRVEVDFGLRAVPEPPPEGPDAADG